MTIDLPIRKLRYRHRIEPEEEAALRAAVSEIRDVRADTVLVHAEDELSVTILLLDGLMCRYKDLRGGQRQVTEIHLAGDIPDLHGFVLRRLDHNVMSLTACRLAFIPHHRLREIVRDFPRLTHIFWFETNVDAAIHREWALSLGRRSALSRLAHLFCELRVRAGVVGLGDDDGYPLKLTQTDLVESLGLTAVHVNRTLQELRERGLMEFRGGRVTVKDLAGLERVGEFNPSYLYLEQRER